jgi:Aspartyl protease
MTSFFFTVSFAHAQAPPLQGSAMLECSGLPCVEIVTGDGKHLHMLIDTGDSQSILDTSVAKEMGIPTAPVNGSDGKPAEGYAQAQLNGVALGEAALGTIKVLVMDIATYIKQDRMPKCDGTLAYTAFKDRLLELDYRKKTIRTSGVLPADLKCPGFCGDLTYPTFGKKGPHILVATGFTVNQKPLSVQIDTLFSGSMLVFPPSVAKLGLTKESSSSTKEFFPYTDGGVDMIKAQAENEAFGSHVLATAPPVFFATPAVHLPDGMFDGTVGHALFKDIVLTLDLHTNHIWIS